MEYDTTKRAWLPVVCFIQFRTGLQEGSLHPQHFSLRRVGTYCMTSGSKLLHSQSPCWMGAADLPQVSLADCELVWPSTKDWSFPHLVELRPQDIRHRPTSI